MCETMKTEYSEIKLNNGKEAVEFNVVTRKGSIHGLYLKEENTIRVHLVSSQHGLKGLMNVLINRFKTRKVIFSPLITDGVENKVRGKVKIIPADAEGNPYGEPIRVLETIWK